MPRGGIGENISLDLIYIPHFRQLGHPATWTGNSDAEHGVALAFVFHASFLALHHASVSEACAEHQLVAADVMEIEPHLSCASQFWITHGRNKNLFQSMVSRNIKHLNSTCAESRFEPRWSKCVLPRTSSPSHSCLHLSSNPSSLTFPFLTQPRIC